MVHSLTIFSSWLVSLLVVSVADGYVLQSADAQFAGDSATAGMLRMKLSLVEANLNSVLSPLASREEEEKRQATLPFSQRERGNFYVVDLNIGTPPQVVQLAIDTGSSDIWVNPTCETGTEPATCMTFARFNASRSSTVKYRSLVMGINYGIGSVGGEYWTDNVQLGGGTVIDQRFGIATSSQSMNIGLMGVGLGNGWGTIYPNIIDQLALQGLTQSRAFSLDLASISTTEGSIIFGGIDSGKYSGSLRKLPMIPYNQAPDGFPRYWVYMNSIGITKPGQASSTISFSGTQAVFLDSGGTLSRLPFSIVDPIATALSATSIGSGYYTVPCSLLTAPGSVDFGFGDASNPLIISVPYSDFIWQAGYEFCYLGVAANADGDSTYVLGDTFLRSAFVVYDVDNFNLHMAPAANCGTNLLSIGSGVDAVPSVVGCGVIASTSTAAAKPTSSAMSSSKLTSSTTLSSSSFKSSSVLSSLRTSSTAVAKSSSASISSSQPSTSTTSISSRINLVSSTKVSTNSLTSTQIKSSSTRTVSSSMGSSSSTKFSTKTSVISMAAATTSILLQIPAAPTLVKCSKDHCLRQMTNSKNEDAAVAFCSSYMSAPVALPTFLSNCKSVPSLVSSACQCAASS